MKSQSHGRRNLIMCMLPFLLCAAHPRLPIGSIYSEEEKAAGKEAKRECCLQIKLMFKAHMWVRLDLSFKGKDQGPVKATDCRWQGFPRCGKLKERPKDGEEQRGLCVNCRGVRRVPAHICPETFSKRNQTSSRWPLCDMEDAWAHSL